MSFLKRIFNPSSGTATTKDTTSPDPVRQPDTAEAKADPAKFVEFIVTSLVSQPDAVTIEQTRETEEDLSILICCDKSDMGRVIGKRGRTISAIRSLAIDAASRAGIRNLKVELKD